ncbi:MAG: App1 family protein [Betaproteobacteria bacterium]|nr:App1 family protein [Betaproteobacteria bacterium]
MFLPGIAVEQAEGSFSVNIDAWVFEKESKRIATSALISWMNVDFSKLSSEQKALFAERTHYFRTDSERGKQVRVRLADQVFTLPRTNGPGRTHAELSVGREWVKWQDGSDGFGWISWALEAPGHPLHGQEGRAKVIPAEGVSVVSDIDDTIKISEVRSKKALVHNTFLKPFRAVPGMAEWYQEIARNERQASFHYLTASPIQLYPALSEFLEDARFPPGLLHLRESTSKRNIHASRKGTIAHKKNVITRLLTTWPQRKFILVGDSGESDPEIYADIARSYPERILAIHIRNVTNEDRTALRYQQTFAGIDPQIWYLRD